MPNASFVKGCHSDAISDFGTLGVPLFQQKIGTFDARERNQSKNSALRRSRNSHDPCRAGLIEDTREFAAMIARALFERNESHPGTD